MAQTSPEQLPALIVEVARAAAPVSYLACACLGLVLGDWFGALEFDLALLKEAKSRVVTAYFVARSCSVIALSIFIALMSTGSFHVDICTPLSHVLSTFIGLATAASQYLFVGRVSSLWFGTAWIRHVMLFTWFLTTLSWIPQIVALKSVQNPVGLLTCIPANPPSKLVIIPYFFNMAYDLLVFALTIIGFYRQGKLHIFRRGPTDSKLTHRLLVTTILYFCIITLFHVGQNVTFWVAKAPARKGLTAPLHIALINLRQLALGNTSLPVDARARVGGGNGAGGGATNFARRDLNVDVECHQPYPGTVHLQPQVPRQASSDEHSTAPVLHDYSKSFGSAPGSIATPSLNAAPPTPELYELYGWTK